LRSPSPSSTCRDRPGEKLITVEGATVRDVVFGLVERYRFHARATPLGPISFVTSGSSRTGSLAHQCPTAQLPGHLRTGHRNNEPDGPAEASDG